MMKVIALVACLVVAALAEPINYGMNMKSMKGMNMKGMNMKGMNYGMYGMPGMYHPGMYGMGAMNGMYNMYNMYNPMYMGGMMGSMYPGYMNGAFPYMGMNGFLGGSMMMGKGKGYSMGY